MDNYDQVLLQMQEFGIELLDKNLPLKVDTAKRVTCGKGGKDYYRLYTFRPDAGGCYIVGSYGTYRHGGSFAKVEVDWTPLSEAERSRMAAERLTARAAGEAKRQEMAALAAMGAADLLASAFRTGHSPYLERKQVAGESCRFLADGTLVIPLMRYDLPVADRLHAVQRILPSGQKYFSKGFGKPGCAVRLGPISADPSMVLVCEGYATGLSVRMATDKKLPVYVALDAGNLEHVVPLLAKLYPCTRLLICADDDWLTRDQHTQALVNPGRMAARNIARKVAGCDMVWPIFKAKTREMGDTDFNDLHVREGLDAVRRQLAGVVAAMARRYD